MAATPIRVLAVLGSPEGRQLLVLAQAADPGIEVEWTESADVTWSDWLEPADVVVVDGDEPASGADVLRIVTASAPPDGDESVIRLDAGPDVLASAIRAVASGLRVVDPRVAARAGAWDEPSPNVELTARESEVLALVAEGLSNKLIASRLGISPHTVKHHLGTMMAKLEAASRTELVYRAARSGLVSL